MIEALGDQGDGVATVDGRRLFVPVAAPGDRLRVRLGPMRAGRQTALPLELIAEGPERTEPPCPHFGTCGGCVAQHLTADAYRRWKRDRVARALARHGLDPGVVDPVVEIPSATRRRATFAARRLSGGAVLGFNERASARIVDLTTCLVLRPDIVAALPALRRVIGDIAAPSEAIDVSVTRLDDGLDVLFVADREPDLATRERLATFAEHIDAARVSWQVPGGSPQPVAHRRAGTVVFGGIGVEVPPGAFLQASAEAEAALLGLATGALVDVACVADLYAGVGTFALSIAGRSKVRAVDGSAAATAALGEAVRRHGLGGRISVATRDLARNPLSAQELAGVDAVIFDPPRQGAKAQAQALAGSAVPTVVAVSCSAASFARDAEILVGGGYRLERVTPVDQFVWSSHIELVAVFRR